MNMKLLESYVINDVIVVVKESKGYKKGKCKIERREW